MIRMLNDDELGSIAGSDVGFGALMTDKGCLPLVSLDLDVRVDGLLAHGTVSQSFQNVFHDPLEATYVFPLPPRAAVIGFCMTVDGVIIEGRIDERSKARADYDEAIRRGQSAAIAEEERPDVFTLRVGNIPAKSLARVQFTIVAPLSIDTLEATYRFPLVVSDRYCPGAPLDGDPVGDGVLPDTDLVPDASRISPPVLLPGFPNPVRLGIRVVIAGDRLREGDLAASLPVKVAGGNDQLYVVAEPGQRLDRDFVIRWPLPLDPLPKAAIAIETDVTRPIGMGRKEETAEAPGDGTFSCVLLPSKQPDQCRTPRDVVFLLDRSGSMSGWQIAAARRAVARMIDTLSADDRVAIIAFDSSVEHHGETCELLPANDRTRWSLLEWLSHIDARGGTELEQALKTGLGLLKRRKKKKKAVENPGPDDAPARDPILVLVTDGQVGDEDRVLARLTKSLGHTTLHVVGIDNSANEGLLSRLADSSGGTHEIVESEDRLDDVMDRIQERIVAPILTDVRLEGHGIEIISDSVVPAKRLNLYPGVPLVLRGRCRGSSGLVTVRGQERDGGAWQADTAPRTSAAPGLGALWARGRLRQLEDQYAVGWGQDGEAIERRMIDLSTSFGVLCKFTAIVAIDPRTPNAPVVATDLRRIIQPVEQFGGMAFEGCEGEHEAPECYFADAGSDDLEALLEPESGDDYPAEQAMLREVIALLKPRSGDLGDVPPKMVSMLVGEVDKVIAMLRADGASDHVIEPLLDALDQIRSDLSNRAALLTLLNVLATFASPVESWWFEDVPF